MTSDAQGNRPLSEEELQELVASSDAGARNPIGAVGLSLALVAVSWSLFQVILASPLSNYLLPGAVNNNSRLIHLAFALMLGFMAYPAMSRESRNLVGFWLGHIGTLLGIGAFGVAVLLAIAPGLSVSAAVVVSALVALVLAVDVSGSVDATEYRIQMDGLAAALRDPVVSESLVRGRSRILLLQWTGSTRQRITTRAPRRPGAATPAEW